MQTIVAAPNEIFRRDFKVISLLSLSFKVNCRIRAQLAPRRFNSGTRFPSRILHNFYAIGAGLRAVTKSAQQP
jgi:hypothetical protein